MKQTRALFSGGPVDGRVIELNKPPVQYLYIPIVRHIALREAYTEDMQPFLQATYRARGVDLNRSVGWHVLYEFVK